MKDHVVIYNPSNYMIPCDFPEGADARGRREMRDTREPDSGEGWAVKA